MVLYDSSVFDEVTHPIVEGEKRAGRAVNRTLITVCLIRSKCMCLHIQYFAPHLREISIFLHYVHFFAALLEMEVMKVLFVLTKQHVSAAKARGEKLINKLY